MRVRCDLELTIDTCVEAQQAMLAQVSPNSMRNAALAASTASLRCLFNASWFAALPFVPVFVLRNSFFALCHARLWAFFHCAAAVGFIAGVSAPCSCPCARQKE